MSNHKHTMSNQELSVHHVHNFNTSRASACVLWDIFRNQNPSKFRTYSSSKLLKDLDTFPFGCSAEKQPLAISYPLKTCPQSDLKIHLFYRGLVALLSVHDNDEQADQVPYTRVSIKVTSFLQPFSLTSTES